MKNVCRSVLLVLTCGVMLQGACLPDNFWADKAGEILNRSIIAGINAVLASLTTNGIQI